MNRNLIPIQIFVLFHDNSRNQHTNSWWRHQMETFFAVLALCEAKPSQRVVKRSFWDAGDLRRHRPNYDVTILLLKNLHINIISLCFNTPPLIYVTMFRWKDLLSIVEISLTIWNQDNVMLFQNLHTNIISLCFKFSAPNLCNNV